jgi:hypothetical protein
MKEFKKIQGVQKVALPKYLVVIIKCQMRIEHAEQQSERFL